VSAIYFKGKWKTIFSEKNTKTETFYLADGKTAEVPMMETTNIFPLLIQKTFDLIELPYKGGVASPEISLFVFLPKNTTDLKDLEKQLTPDNLTNWIGRLQEDRVHVFIPKFQLTDRIVLNETLKKLGMETAFSPQADFSGITGSQDFAINNAVHQSFLSVDEKGTEAAAATAISIGVTSIFIPEKSYVFRADHPFLFMIMEKNTGSILFLGRLQKP
jgi:serpin B